MKIPSSVQRSFVQALASMAKDKTTVWPRYWAAYLAPDPCLVCDEGGNLLFGDQKGRRMVTKHGQTWADEHRITVYILDLTRPRAPVVAVLEPGTPGDPVPLQEDGICVFCGNPHNGTDESV